MENENPLLKQLLEKYTLKTISKDEFDLLLTYFDTPEYLQYIEDFMDKDWDTLRGFYPLSQQNSDKLFQNIIADPEFKKSLYSKNNKVHVFRRWLLTSAAAAAALITVGIFIYYKSGIISPKEPEQGQFIGIVAGGNKAVITLSNGKKLILNENKEGVLLNANKIVYSDGALVNTKSESESKFSEDLIHAISTPKGGTYRITLSDGTKIWLNAATTLTCASDFKTAKYRIVNLDGEAYFEVAKDKKRPFIVKSKNQTVKVLGTHFNISCYRDEKNTKTTLVEGSVEVNNTLLKPNQQSIFDNQQIKVLAVDANKAIAWKNGKFVFNSESLESIMKKLARWYNFEVVMNGDLSDKVFTGSISRYDNISNILEKISYTQAVKFKIEGRRIFVMP